MSNLFLNGTQIPSGYTVTIYKYEPFYNLFTPPDQTGSTGYLKLISASTLIRTMVSEASITGVQFQSPGYLPWDPQTRGYTGATSTNEQIVIGWGSSIVSGSVSVVQTYVVNVIIKPGRFVVPVLDTPAYQLYVNEPISQTYGSDIAFNAPGNLAVSTPFTSPALPPGLTFAPVGTSPSLYWVLTGTPLTGIPATSYTVYARGASNTSFTISKTMTISIGGERVSLSVSPSSNVTMTVNAPIVDTTITAWYPNLFAGNLKYTWSFLPDGLRFVDISSNTVVSPFSPSDANATMTLTGTPTTAAAQFYRSLGTSNIVTNVVATRQTTPAITATQPLSLTFGPTVLFDSISIPTLFVESPIDGSSIAFRANTYFPTSSNMASITAPDGLPPGLSLSHVPNNQYAYLTGTPTAGADANYNILATNSNGLTSQISVPIKVETDIVSISGSDVCYNFVISRPLNSNLTGYYPSNITYTATSSAGGNPVISATGFAGTGISVDISGSTLSLSGIPDTLTALTTAVIRGSNPATGAFGTRNLTFAVITDDISITNPSGKQTFFQNQAITPIQFLATTLSERPIISWRSPNLPDGLFLSTTGLLSGIPTSNTSGFPTFDVVASTGYISETNTFSYDTISDDVLIALVQDPSPIAQQFSNVEIRAVSYSGNQVTPVIANIDPKQEPPISLTLTGGNLSGDLTTSPGILPQYRIRIDASSGLLAGQQHFLMTPNNPSTQRRFVMDISLTTGFSPPPSFSAPKGVATVYANESRTLQFVGATQSNLIAPTSWTTSLTTGDIEYGYIGDMAQSSNTCILVAGSKMYRSSNSGNSWTLVPSSDISSIPGIVGLYSNIPPFGLYTISGPILTSIATDGSSNWLALGVGYDSNLGGSQRTILRTSSNDGVTWTDASLTSTFLQLDSNSRLFYNSGRYFLAQSGGSSDTSYRADSSNLSLWTGASGGMPNFIGPAYCFAFSNDYVLCGGTGGAVDNPLVYSTDNGTTWNPTPGAPIPLAANVYWITRQGSNWYLTADDVYFTSNVPNFSSQSTVLTSGVYLIDYDGGVFNTFGFYPSLPGFMSIDTFPYDATSTANTLGITSTRISNYKRAFTRFIDNGPTGGTITIVGNPGLSFVAPTTTEYTFLQFVGANIYAEAQGTAGDFIYYYATDLPQGLRLVLDPSGISTDISGIPTLYNSLPTEAVLFAREPINQRVASLSLSMRVISPFVLKPQSGAGGYTAFLRQYVEINGAQGARDAVALPNQENPIGKFASPGVPDVVSPSNCPC